LFGFRLFIWALLLKQFRSRCDRSQHRSQWEGNFPLFLLHKMLKIMGFYSLTLLHQWFLLVFDYWSSKPYQYYSNRPNRANRYESHLIFVSKENCFVLWGSMRLTHKKTVFSHKLCTFFWSSKLSHKKN